VGFPLLLNCINGGLMSKQETRHEPSAFPFRAEGESIDENKLTTSEHNPLSLEDIRESLRHIEVLSHRVSMLEGAPAPGMAKQSLTYVEDSKFYTWLKENFKNRIARKRYFEFDYIVGEPCWDMLLDLCISEIEGKKVSVTSVCIASGARPTTALRWVSLLERDKMIEKCEDPSDKRRTFVRISRKTFDDMFGYFKYTTRVKFGRT
jgi:hypothetical protein